MLIDTNNLQLAVVEVSTTSTRPIAPVYENLQAEADAMADEIIAELLAETHTDLNGTRPIVSEPEYNDISSPEQLQTEKIARLKRLVADGDYRLDSLAIAEALFDSGDLS